MKARGSAVPVRSMLAFGAIMLGGLMAIAAIVFVALALVAALRPGFLPDVLP